MRSSRFTGSQILPILKQNEEGAKVPDLCREHGMSAPLLYRWCAKFGGMDASLMKRRKELSHEKHAWLSFLALMKNAQSQKRENLIFTHVL